MTVLCIAEFLGMAVWFSASAVVPALAREWALDGAGQAWLTMSVQAGFIAGTLISALLNLPDRIAGRTLFSVSALLAACATAAIPALAHGNSTALPLRFATGLCLAGVYPVGMKIMATWTRANRGFWLGLLVGALTLGTAAPHLLRAYAANWRAVLYGAAALATLGGVLAAALLAEGPHRKPAPPFRWSYAGELFASREVALANLGYLGHMWELYAMWAWAPVLLAASFGRAGAAAAFAAIAAGAAGCALAGKMADRLGRCNVTVGCLVVSGACSLAVGFVYGRSPAALAAVCVVWGFAVVADSAQYSACVTELCRPEYAGTALALQTCLGFALTLASIRLVPWVQARAGWGWAFAMLAPGPAAGACAMLLLRRTPRAAQMAGGRR